ncbi:hypothetical protein BOX15_Mlig003761g2 [Macrostomum lignano]|uniref:Uncharacterized protein n=1 Tax=Macrostomum lignano TaxID=282301 RepID=A0A267GIN9_9PLAT|nr:hypothetical protein BOX15_Mlig003761g2 [Macrostomum lignano]
MSGDEGGDDEAPAPAAAAATDEWRRVAAESRQAWSERRAELARIREREPAERREVLDQMERSFQMVERFLRNRKARLAESLNELAAARSEAMQAEEARAEAADAAAAALLQLLEDQPADSAEIEAAAAQLAAERPSVHPSESDSLSFFPAELDQLLSRLHLVGLVVLGGVQAANCRLQEAGGDLLRACPVATECVATVLARDSQNRPVDPAALASVSCAASISSPFENSYSVAVQQEDDQLRVKFQLDRPGVYDLNVKLLGEHIRGSPFAVHAVAPENGSGGGGVSDGVHRRPARPTRPASSSRMPATSRSIGAVRGSTRSLTSASSGGGVAASLRRSVSRTGVSRRAAASAAAFGNHEPDDLVLRVGARGRGHGEFSNPQGARVSGRTGRILVVDANNANVQSFGPGGDFISRFGIRGREPGHLQRPVDVAESAETGDILVSDYDGRCVHVFSAEGRYKKRFGANRLAGPKGLTVLSDGRVAVVDNRACCVLLFTPLGKVERRFGSRGVAEHQFAGPHYIATTSRDELVVTDFHNHCVKVFDSQGAFLFVIGCTGREAGRFNAPTGVAVDTRDNIIVADWGSSSLQIFNSEGRFLSSVSTHADQLYGPQGVAYLPEFNQLVVVDTGNHCFKVYKNLSA